MTLCPDDFMSPHRKYPTEIKLKLYQKCFGVLYEHLVLSSKSFQEIYSQGYNTYIEKMGQAKITILVSGTPPPPENTPGFDARLRKPRLTPQPCKKFKVQRGRRPGRVIFRSFDHVHHLGQLIGSQ